MLDWIQILQEALDLVGHKSLLRVSYPCLLSVGWWVLFLFLLSITGDRIFPPQTGITYSTWICVDKFSDPRTDPHPVRILTLARNLPESHLICLTVLLSARDKAIIVSTNEAHMQHSKYD